MLELSIGDMWWVQFPFKDIQKEKLRPAVIIDDNRIAILAMYVTSQNKVNPFSIQIRDWQYAGLTKPSWARIDRIITIDEWHMESKMGELSDRDLSMFLQLAKEALSGKRHEFTLLAIKNLAGKYLQVFDERWKCWLFPYVRSTDDNRSNADVYAGKLLGKEVETRYISNAIHCKYSESDAVYKIYDHKLYETIIQDMPEHMKNDEFEIDGRMYKWLSIEEMESDDAIMEKNDDVVAFVKKKCS